MQEMVIIPAYCNVSLIIVKAFLICYIYFLSNKKMVII